VSASMASSTPPNKTHGSPSSAWQPTTQPHTPIRGK
jgi:hypothetical protein